MTEDNRVQAADQVDREARIAAALRKSRGLGSLTDADLLLVIAADLEKRADAASVDEAKRLKKYASKRERPSAWKEEDVSRVPSLLRRLAAGGDDCAQELLSRLIGKGGEHVNEAASGYWQQLADSYHAEGNADAAALCEHIAYRSARYYRMADEFAANGNGAAAALCKLIADKHDGGRHLITSESGKRMDPRVEAAQAKLDEYEFETAGMKAGSPQELAIAKRLAAKHNKDLHDYRTDISRARKARNKRNSAHPNWKV